MPVAPELAFNALVKHEDGLWIAHCLELDIVATGETPEAAVNDLRDLILAQVSTAIANKNMEHLYHPAPAEVWTEYATAQSRGPRQSAAGEQPKAYFQTVYANAFCCTPCHA